MIVLLTGCGTMCTRLGHTSFGAYPGQAIAADIEAVATGPTDIMVLAFVVSVPFDIVLDTLFLAPDLVLWAAGHKKDGIASKM